MVAQVTVVGASTTATLREGWYVESHDRARPQWVVQPLLDAGLEPEEVCSLVFRLAFAAVVSEGRDTLVALRELVGDRSAEVQAAWAEMIGRLQLLES